MRLLIPQTLVMGPGLELEVYVPICSKRLIFSFSQDGR